MTLERADATRFTARIFTDETIALGERVTLSFETRHIRLFDADGKRIAPDDEDA